MLSTIIITGNTFDQVYSFKLHFMSIVVSLNTDMSLGHESEIAPRLAL